MIKTSYNRRELRDEEIRLYLSAFNILRSLDDEDIEAMQSTINNTVQILNNELDKYRGKYDRYYERRNYLQVKALSYLYYSLLFKGGDEE